MKQIINLGSSVGAHNGDGARTGGQKINDNFTELYGFSEVIFNELTILEDTKLAIANNLSDLEDASTARTNLGIGNIDNTSDANKPVSTAQATADATVLSSANSYTDSKVASVYKLKGSVANYAALPSSGQVVGDVWNLVDTGANYVWTGTVWDELGTTVDISVKANLASPTFTGIPIAPTATAGTNNTQIATTAFTTTAIAGKMNNPSLTASYIPKALTANTIGNSRIVDTDTYLGIGTVNTPTKDITLGYQANREIGIEESTNIVVGRDLSINAGRTVNYVPSTGFIRLNLLQVQYYGADSLSNGDILITGNYNIVYKLVSGSPPFVNYGIAPVGGMISIHPTNDNIIYSVSINISTSIYISTNGGVSFSAISGITPRNYIYVKIMPNGDAYATVSGSNDIYKRTGGAGDFIAMGFTARSYKYIISTPSGDAYFPVAGDDIYKINSGTSVLTALGQTFRSWNNGYFLNGDLYIGVAGGASYKQTGLAGNFVLNTLFTYPVAPVGNLMNVTVSKTTNNVYVPAYDSDVWVQYNNGEGTPNLQGGTLKLNAGTGKGSGDSSIEMWTGQVLASGTTMQTSTLRAKINNTGLMTLPSVTNAMIDADTTGKAVVTKEYLGLAASFTATGTATTTFTVTIGITQANNTYKVVACPSNALSAVMFYINNKTTTTFDVVFLTALTGAVAFDWILKP